MMGWCLMYIQIMMVRGRMPCNLIHPSLSRTRAARFIPIVEAEMLDALFIPWADVHPAPLNCFIHIVYHLKSFTESRIL